MVQNKNKRLITWEKWKTPIEMVEDDESEEENNSYDDDKPQFVITPNGVFPTKFKMTADQSFNFWVGHTNFEITYDLVPKISTIPGIEAYKTISRYRFMIGIGKNPAFSLNANEIFKDITKAICEEESESPPK